MIECNQTATDVIWQIVNEQIQRMAGLDKFPNPQFTPAAFRELCLAGLRADDTMHLAEVVSRILESGRRCPTPADLRSEISPPRQEKVWQSPTYEIDTTPETVRQRRERLLKAQEHALSLRIREIRLNPSLRTIEPDGKFKQTPARNLVELRTREMNEQW